jgi:thiamine-phosphate pyrophosphorylase
MTRPDFSLELYLVTDKYLAGSQPLTAIVHDAIQGGATFVQYREKSLATRAMIEQALALHNVCKATHTPFVINDRVDVALAVRADGVHLGQDDMSAADARRILGPNAIIGVSVRSVQEAADAFESQADYVAANGVWDTSTKTDHGHALGLEALRDLVRSSTLPLVAIGGINETNAKLIASTGAKGIAVVSAVMTAPSARNACFSLLRAFRGLV